MQLQEDLQNDKRAREGRRTKRQGSKRRMRANGTEMKNVDVLRRCGWMAASSGQGEKVSRAVQDERSGAT